MDFADQVLTDIIAWPRVLREFTFQKGYDPLMLIDFQSILASQRWNLQSVTIGNLQSSADGGNINLREFLALEKLSLTVEGQC